MSSSRRSRSRNVPTKLRRRQSDAKWRASVQSCYESLKLIIPESRRANRRKLSKALILQETENHILYLEDVLTTLIEEKGKQIEHGIITPSSSVPRSFQEIKDEFARKVQPSLTHIPKPRKLQRKNVRCPEGCTSGKLMATNDEPDKIICTLLQGDQYYYLSGKTLCLQKATPPKVNTPSHRNVFGLYSTTVAPDKSLHNVGPSSPGPVISQTEPVHQGLSLLMRLTPCDPKDAKQEVFMPQVTPNKNDGDSDSTSHRSPWQSAALSSIQNHPAFLTPSKVTRKLPFDVGSPNPLCTKSSVSKPDSPLQSPGTPFAKEPLFSLELGDNFMEVPSTPVLKTEELSGDECEDSRSLICTESIDNMELGDEEDWQTQQDQTSGIYKSTHKRLLQNTPVQEHRKDNSCCPSEKDLQERPKKILRRGSLFSPDVIREVTPAKLVKLEEKPKCCKQLEQLYDEEEKMPTTKSTQLAINIPNVSSHTDCSNFDGYYYFYRQMTGVLETHLSQEEMGSPTFSETISQMWQDMNEDQKTTMMTIAALENSNSSSSSTELSEDLSDISVVPISNVDLIPEFQVVPTDLKTKCTEE